MVARSIRGGKSMNRAWMQGIKAQCRAKSDYDRTGNHRSVFLLPEQIEDAVSRLYDHEFFLEDITAMDSRDGLVVIYHFDHFTQPGRVALYLVIPHEKPEVPSISGIFSGAEWHEREACDFYGIRFTGHPDLVPLLLPEDVDYHPLIKEDNGGAPLNDVLNPGEIVDRNPDFKLFQKEAAKDLDGNPDGDRI